MFSYQKAFLFFFFKTTVLTSNAHEKKTETRGAEQMIRATERNKVLQRTTANDLTASDQNQRCSDLIRDRIIKLDLKKISGIVATRIRVSKSPI